MPLRNPRTAIGSGLVSLVVLLITGCDRLSHSKPARAGAASPAAATVEVVAPRRAAVRRVTEQPGQVEAFEVAPIHAKITGYVEYRTVDIGDRVKKGQVLARLSVPELDAEVSQKQALIEQAKAERAQAAADVRVSEAAVISARAKLVAIQAGIKRVQADRARWQAEFRRIEQLVRENATTGSLLDETRSKLRAAEAAEDEVLAQVKSAEAVLNENQAQLEKARSDVFAAEAKIRVARFDHERVNALKGYAAIVAPFDGTVIKREVDAGHLTQPGATADPLFVVSRADVVRVSVAVPELYATAVQLGQRVEVRVQALRNRRFEGKVTRTAFALDSKTRTLTTEIDIPNPEGSLRPGQFVHAAITLEEHSDALTLPATALLRDGEKAFCVRVVNGKAQRTPISVGINDGDKVEILSGIGAGDLVVKANPVSLVNGQPVVAERPAVNPAEP